MAMTTPVIVTAAGGVREIVTDGIDGLCVPPRDADALAAAVRELARDPERRHAMALRGRQTIVDRFDARIGAEILHRLILGEAPRARAA
jgi:glycosyltransferase involved in cell wall biosynthesis